MRRAFDMFTWQLIVFSFMINVMLTRADAYMSSYFGAAIQTQAVSTINLILKIAPFAAIVCAIIAFAFHLRYRSDKASWNEMEEEVEFAVARYDIVFLVASIILPVIKLASYYDFLMKYLFSNLAL